MRKVRRALPKIGQVIDIFSARQARPNQAESAASTPTLIGSRLVVDTANRRAGPRTRLAETLDARGHFFGFTTIDERTARADRLERLVNISPKLGFVDIFDAVYPKLRIFHVALRPEGQPSAPASVERIGHERRDDRPVAKTKVYASLSEAGSREVR